MSFTNATPPPSPLRPPVESSTLSISIVVHRLDELELRRNLITLRLAADRLPKPRAGLALIDNSEQSELDPRTAATLQKNLAVIDQAISESRAAVRAQPASEPAQQSLVENFKTKIALLQDTVALINEMRKGNEAGAARIVSGLTPNGN